MNIPYLFVIGLRLECIKLDKNTYLDIKHGMITKAMPIDPINASSNNLKMNVYQKLF